METTHKSTDPVWLPTPDELDLLPENTLGICYLTDRNQWVLKGIGLGCYFLYPRSLEHLHQIILALTPPNNP